MVKSEFLDFTSKIVNDIRQKRKWVCFGAGQTFRTFVERYCIKEQLLPLPAYVCDNNKVLWDTKVEGEILVCSPQKLLEEVPEDIVIVISTTLPLSAMEDLIFKLQRYYFLIIPIRQLEAYLYYASHRERILEVYNLLMDDISKELYQNLWNFAVGGITNYASLYSPNAYWNNDVIPKLEDGWEVLYAGAYDGKHIDRALKSNSNIVFHAFEPNPEMYRGLIEKYVNMEQVKIYPFALGSKKETRYIDTSVALAAKIIQSDKSVRENAQIDEIYCSTIDDEIKTKLDLIALDIEGFEPDALAGAKMMIQNYMPTLGICVYHEISHYVDIPLYIKKLNPQYELFFRHHSVVPYESVIYAVNKP